MPVWLVLPLYTAYCFSSFVLTLLMCKYCGVKEENAEAELSGMAVITLASLMPILMTSEVRGVSLFIALLIPIILALAFKAYSRYTTKKQANR